MAYVAWSVVFGEQPTAAKWNILGENDESFNDGTGFANGALGSVNASLANGIVVQVVRTNYTAVATGTTVLPADDTIPQITEGIEFMTQAITPKSATNILVIQVLAMLANTASAPYILGALFQDATANALAGTIERAAAASDPIMLALTHTMVAGTVSSTTFRFRGGSNSAGTTTFNGQVGTRFFGAITKSAIVITEYKAT